jgi:hypothetical protein
MAIILDDVVAIGYLPKIYVSLLLLATVCSARAAAMDLGILCAAGH